MGPAFVLQFPITRKIVLGLGMSLDGYIARPDGAIDFLFIPKDYSMAAFFATVDTAIMGRKSFEAGLKMGGGTFNNFGLATYVFSRTQTPGERDGFTVVDEAPANFVNKLPKRSGRDIWLMVGGELAREFLKADLIDEIHIGILPVLPGEGIPLFPSCFPQRNFSLVENKTYPKGLIALRYECVRAKTRRKRRIRSLPWTDLAPAFSSFQKIASQHAAPKSQRTLCRVMRLGIANHRQNGGKRK